MINLQCSPVKHLREVAGVNLVVRNKPSERGADSGQKLISGQRTEVCGICIIIGARARFRRRCGVMVTASSSHGCACLESRFVSTLSRSINDD